MRTLRFSGPYTLVLSAAAAAFACSTSAPSSGPPAPGDNAADASIDAADPYATPIAPEAQRDGDPKKGLEMLGSGGYIGCGIPWSGYSAALSLSGPTPDDQKIPGRTGHNAELPYGFNAFTMASGIEVVSQNCFACHAGHINGALVLGLGAADADFTGSFTDQVRQLLPFVSNPDEKAVFNRWLARMDVVAPYSKTPTLGMNPADEFTGILFAHRDPQTLAWSDTPRFPVPAPEPVPVDVPPWWRMKKKSAMFYMGSGRGDHARIMMTASTLCVDSVDDARAIDAYFPDVRAFITSIVPPAYPFPIDGALAARGKPVFEATCSRCHGTYGDAWTYPSMLVDLAEIGTDGLLIERAGQFQGGQFANWFNTSFYGEHSRLESGHGYIAPPLDGIWATAPFLHNGSVPTLAALLDSTTRPKQWSRSFDSKDYDPVGVGWKWTDPGHSQAAETDATARAHIYDTTIPGASNAGHTFGDALSSDDRAAVIEYLKTL